MAVDSRASLNKGRAQSKHMSSTFEAPDFGRTKSKHTSSTVEAYVESKIRPITVKI